MTVRDHAVDAILTAETLFGQFLDLVPRLKSLLPADVSVAMGEARSLYPELWAALDRGRTALRERGVDVPGYDELRARQPAAMDGFQVHNDERAELGNVETAAVLVFFGGLGATLHSLGAKQGEANASGLKDARTALDALRNAMPEVDWKSLRHTEARATASALDDFARARRKKLVIGAAAVAALALTGVGLIKIFEKSRAPTAEEEAEQRAIEYREASDEIRELNDVLRANPCDAQAAERRVALFQANSRPGTARKLAKKFLDQCGSNATLKAVADSH
jgi:hypothetical protein